jgi:hypothetical protein
MRGMDFLIGKNGSGPIRVNPITIRKAPMVVTPLGGFLSQIMPHIGAELPVEKLILYLSTKMIFKSNQVMKMLLNYFFPQILS